MINPRAPLDPNTHRYRKANLGHDRNANFDHKRAAACITERQPPGRPRRIDMAILLADGSIERGASRLPVDCAGSRLLNTI